MLLKHTFNSSNQLPVERVEKLESMNNLLSMITLHVDLQKLADTLEEIVAPGRSSAKTKMGRQAYPVLLMLKMLLLQKLYNLSDDQTQYQCLDRISFQRFLAVNFNERIPDAKTCWAFKEKLRQHALGDVIFDEVEKQLQEQGYIPRGGQIVDASLIPVPIQRNTKKENELIKSGGCPADWSEAKSRQKDIDARWTKKRNKSYYGYKVSVNVDNKYKFIRKVHVSAANEHDSQHVEHLIDKRNTSKCWFGDSAYVGLTILTLLFVAGMSPQINKKGSKGKPLSECQKRRNHRLSKTRCRVEHIFAEFIWMGGKMIRCIGLTRATFELKVKCAMYNIRRLCILKRHNVVPS